MSSPGYPSKLSGLLRRREDLIRQLSRHRLILRGSFTEVNTRCGKSNCWCAQSSKAHRHGRLTWSQDGELFTRKIPVEESAHIRQLTRNYRTFRKQRRQLIALEVRIQNALDDYENSLIRRTSKPLAFLNSAPKMSIRSRTRRQKGGVKPKNND